MNVTVVVDEPVFFSEVAGEKNSSGFRKVIRIRSKICDRLARELHRFWVLEGGSLFRYKIEIIIFKENSLLNELQHNSDITLKTIQNRKQL